MRTRILVALVALLMPVAAMAQQAVLQAGPSAPGHVPQYNGQGGFQPVIQDGGGAAGGQPGANPSELGLTTRGKGLAQPPFASAGTGPLGTNLCDYDGPITSAAGYHFLCFSANAQGGPLIVVGAGGAASPLPFTLNVNGAVYPFPFALSGIVGPPSSVIGHVALWNNGAGNLLSDGGALGALAFLNTLAGIDASAESRSIRTITSSTTMGSGDSWIKANASGAAVTYTLAACTQQGRRVTVQKVDSSQNAVTVASAGSDNVDGVASISNQDYSTTIDVLCDGAGSWLLN